MTGKTPEDIVVGFDGSELKPGKYTGIIELHVDCDPPIPISVELEIIPLALTQLFTRLDSPLVYGTTETKSGKSPAKAFLLEINTKTGKTQRSLEVGSSVSDLTIHHEEGRIYIPNWKQGELLAVDMKKFKIVQSYRFSPFKGVGYSRSDVYKVSAGRMGRLVIEAADQWVDMCLLDTETGNVLSKINVRQGDGVFPNPGRYYYHGDSNISNASLHKYDTVGDVFKKLKSARSPGGRHSGARTVIASKDGSKIFWNGSMFDPNLNVLWSIGDEIQSVSPDGNWAFGTKKIYNLKTRKVLRAMPPKSHPNVFNPITMKLVVQEGERIGFIDLPSPPQ